MDSHALVAVGVVTMAVVDIHPAISISTCRSSIPFVEKRVSGSGTGRFSLFPTWIYVLFLDSVFCSSNFPVVVPLASSDKTPFVSLMSLLSRDVLDVSRGMLSTSIFVVSMLVVPIS